MIISVGFIRSSSQVLIKELNWNENILESKLIDVTDLTDLNLQALFFENTEDLNSLASILEKEKMHYPILEAKDDSLNYARFEKISSSEFKDLFFKVSSRWVLSQNLKSVEQLYPITLHFKNLWKKDRITFFEEFWFWLKRNVGFTELSFYFNDVIQMEEKDENNEKKERPKLSQSVLAGEKKPHFQIGGPKEKELMTSYLEKFHDVFEVTEFNSNKAQFVATAQVERSPLIILGRVPQLNSLQKSLMFSVINGIQQ